MRQIIDTTAQLQRLRDKTVKDMTVQLAKQQQVCTGFDNNIKALGYLIQKPVLALRHLRLNHSKT